MNRRWLAYGAAALLLAYAPGCTPKAPETGKEQQRLEEQVERLIITTTERPSPEEDDWYYSKEAQQYRIRINGKTIDSRIPDLARRGLDPDLSYFVAMTAYDGAEFGSLENLSVQGSPDFKRIEKDLHTHPQFTRFMVYLLAEENQKPVVNGKGKHVGVDSFSPDSMQSPGYLERFYSGEMKLKRESPPENVAVRLTHLAHFEGNLEDVLFQANQYQNGKFWEWMRIAKEMKMPDLKEDYEGFYMPLIRIGEDRYLLPVYGIAVTGKMPDGRTVEF